MNRNNWSKHNGDTFHTSFFVLTLNQMAIKKIQFLILLNCENILTATLACNQTIKHAASKWASVVFVKTHAEYLWNIEWATLLNKESANHDRPYSIGYYIKRLLFPIFPKKPNLVLKCSIIKANISPNVPQQHTMLMSY